MSDQQALYSNIHGLPESYSETHNITSEITLLAKLIRGDRVGSTKTYTSKQWMNLLRIAFHHNVTPLLYYQLRNSGVINDLPPAIRSDLLNAYHQTATKNIIIYNELSRVIHTSKSFYELNDRPKIIVLKGAALAATVYNDIAIRPMADIDLFVPYEYMDIISDIFESLGYVQSRPWISPSLKWRAEHYLIYVGGPMNAVRMDIHWELFDNCHDNYNKPMDHVSNLAAAVHIKEFNLRFYQLTPPFHLLFLIHHIMLQHSAPERRLIWFYDIYLMMSRYCRDITWNLLYGLSKEHRLTAALYTALNITERLFQSPTPKRDIPDGIGTFFTNTEQRELLSKKSRSPAANLRRGYKTRPLHWKTRCSLVVAFTIPNYNYLRWRFNDVYIQAWPILYFHWWAYAMKVTLLKSWRHIRPST